jgi:NADPH-dependent glutamate synthase beta subunit-like oxidoreductase
VCSGVSFKAKPVLPPIPGVDGPNVLTAKDLLARRLRFTGQRIVVIGGGTVGLETANYLAVQGNDITVLEMLDTIGRGSDPLYLDYLLRELKERGVEIMTGVQVEAIQTEAVLVRGKDGEKRLIPADLVVLAAGVKPANELARDLQDLNPIVIGDALEPRKIIHAIAEGYAAAAGPRACPDFGQTPREIAEGGRRIAKMRNGDLSFRNPHFAIRDLPVHGIIIL